MQNVLRKAGSSVLLSPEPDAPPRPHGMRPAHGGLGHTSAHGRRVLKACHSGVS